MTSEDDDMTVQQVAKALRVSPATVRRIPSDDLPYHRTPGGHRRYSSHVVEEYRRRLHGERPDGP